MLKEYSKSIVNNSMLFIIFFNNINSLLWIIQRFTKNLSIFTV